MRRLDRDGVGIAYTVAGTGPAILFTHGFGATSAMFDGNVDALARDHTVVTWDQRGHGASDTPTDPAAYSVDLAVGDLVALLDAVGADHAVVAGHSLGGYLSLELHLGHPERIAALVLIGTGPGFRRTEPRDGWNAMAARTASAFEARGLGALGSSEELAGARHRGAAGLVHTAQGVLPQHDARVIESLPSIAVPTLIVVGALDTPFLDSAHYMAGRIPDAELAVLDGARHAPNVTHADEFDERLRSFLDRGGV